MLLNLIALQGIFNTLENACNTLRGAFNKLKQLFPSRNDHFTDCDMLLKSKQDFETGL